VSPRGRPLQPVRNDGRGQDIQPFLAMLQDFRGDNKAFFSTPSCTALITTNPGQGASSLLSNAAFSGIFPHTDEPPLALPDGSWRSLFEAMLPSYFATTGARRRTLSVAEVTPVEDCQKARVGLELPSAGWPAPRRLPRRRASLADTIHAERHCQLGAPILAETLSPSPGSTACAASPSAACYFQPDFDRVSERLSGFTSAV
jgi:hypothetical protein